MLKRFMTIALSMFMVICVGIPVFAAEKAAIPVYASVEEWEASGDESNIVRIQNKKLRYDNGYTEYVFSKEVKDNDVRVGYHPDCKEWKYADGYYFSNSKTVSFSPSVSLTYAGIVSVGVSVAKSSSSGFIRTANGNKKSRPWVRADIKTKLYDTCVYDNSGKLLYRWKENYKKATSSDVQIFIDYQ